MASPELSGLIEALRANPILPPGGDLGTSRANLAAMTTSGPAPEGVRYEPAKIGGVAAEWARTEIETNGRTLLYFHGGAYCIGSVATHRYLVGNLALAIGVEALSLDYRLAPEHPFPAAIDDAVAAYRALVASGVSPSRIVLAGDSAGGGLTVATLLALRDAGDRLPATAVCISPWLDMTGSGASLHVHAAEDPMLSSEILRYYGAMYLAGKDPRAPLASPALADPSYLRGLPPLLIHVGTAEVLLDDATRFAENARKADVDVTLEIWDDMIHVWHAFAPILPEATRAISRIAAYVRPRLAA